MNGITILVIAIGLAMDAAAVSVAAGGTLREDHCYYAVRAAFFFGLFQGGMPFLGYSIGVAGSDLIAPYGHWIAFLLLLLIGGRMIYASYKGEGVGIGILSLSTLLFLAVATSIDALAAGVTFAILGLPIVTAALVIGVVTFIASLLGVWVGLTSSRHLGDRVELAGGVVLIAIGMKILLEGLSL